MRLYNYFILFLCLYFLSCKNDDSSILQIHEGYQKSQIITDYKYYFRNSLEKIKNQAWTKIIIDTVNDEYNQWIEAKFYLSNNEWIKIEIENINKISTSSLETNTNYFLINIPIKIEDNLSSWILKDSASFDFDEGKMTYSIKNIEIRSVCFDEISADDFNRIIMAREEKDITLLPEKVKLGKVNTIRILNN